MDPRKRIVEIITEGGDSINVKWTDGPTTAQVDAIVNRYAAGSFDGMTDCYDYHRSAWTEAFGYAKYVNTSREYSPAVLEWARQRFGAGRDEWNREPAYMALQNLSIARVKA